MGIDPFWLVVIIVLVGLFALFAFCVWGFTQSLKRSNQVKKMQAASDYVFQTEQGPYKFKYMVKAFDNYGRKTVKIIVVPELGFSDLKNSATNELLSFTAKVNSNTPKQSVEYADNLCADLTIDLGPEYLTNGVLKASFEVTTSWYLGGSVVDTLKFTYNK